MAGEYLTHAVLLAFFALQMKSTSEWQPLAAYTTADCTIFSVPGCENLYAQPSAIPTYEHH